MNETGEGPKSVLGKIADAAADRLLRGNPPIPEAVDRQYQERHPQIEALYSRAYLWHGTGRYQWGEEGEAEDVLAGLLKSGGLVPRRDGFDLASGVVDSTSLAFSRMYARLYAQLHLAEGEELEYQHGSRGLWAAKFIGTTTLLGLRENLGGKFMHQAIRSPREVLRKLSKSSRDWVSKIRSDAHQDPQSPREIFTSLHSDIKGNYPIIIGVNRDGVVPTQSAGYINKYETRSTEPVPIVAFTHLEVPLAHVDETEAFLREQTISLPVIPIECAEQYSSQFDFNALTQAGYLKLPASTLS